METMEKSILAAGPSRETTLLERIRQDHNEVINSATAQLCAVQVCMARINGHVKNEPTHVELINTEDTLMDAFGKTLYNMKVLHDSLSELRRELESIV